jgi:hypothetical protein
MKLCKALHRGRFGPESDLHCDLAEHSDLRHLDSLEDIWWEENKAAEPVALLKADPVRVLKEAA